MSNKKFIKVPELMKQIRINIRLNLKGEMLGYKIEALKELTSSLRV